MDIDINKRKCMNNIMEKFIDESKFKVNEVKKIKTFNRLIEDSNRRYEAYDKMMEFLEDEDNKNNELLKMELNKENIIIQIRLQKFIPQQIKLFILILNMKKIEILY